MYPCTVSFTYILIALCVDHQKNINFSLVSSKTHEFFYIFVKTIIFFYIFIKNMNFSLFSEEMWSEPHHMHRHSSSSALPDLHRSHDHGPLVIPNAVQQQSLLQHQNLQNRRSSAEELVERVILTLLYISHSFSFNISFFINNLLYNCIVYCN